LAFIAGLPAGLPFGFMHLPALAQALGFGQPLQGFMVVSFDVAALQTILRGVSAAWAAEGLKQSSRALPSQQSPGLRCPWR
jgi:hypothetical protein